MASVFRMLPVRLALAVTAMAVVLALPWALVTGQFGSREVPLDTDAYVRHYLFLSSDRSLVDEATTTFVSNPNRGTSDQPTR